MIPKFYWNEIVPVVISGASLSNPYWVLFVSPKSHINALILKKVVDLADDLKYIGGDPGGLWSLYTDHIPEFCIRNDMNQISLYGFIT